MEYLYGSLLTALVLGGGYLIYRVVTSKRRHSVMIENFGVLYEAGYRAGQRSKENANELQNGD